MANESSYEMTEMSRFLSIAIFLLLLATFVYAEESILDSINIATEPPEIYPGESINITFYINNPSEYTHWISIPLKNIPEGLRVSSTLGFLSLKPNQSGNITFVFTSSAGIPLKSRWFSYDLIDEAYDPEKLWILKTDKLLDNQRAIQFYPPVGVYLEIYPEYIYTGQEGPVELTFRLKNPNPRNHSVAIDFYSRGIGNYTVYPVTLLPKTERNVSIAIPVPAQPGEYTLSYKIIEKVQDEKSETIRLERSGEIKLAVRRFSPRIQKGIDFPTENWLRIMAAAALTVAFIFRRRIADYVDKVSTEIKAEQVKKTEGAMAANLLLLLGALVRRYAKLVLLLLGAADGLFIQLRFEFFREHLLLFALLHLEVLILYFAGRRWELVRKAVNRAIENVQKHGLLVYLFAGIALGFSALPVFRFLLEYKIALTVFTVVIVLLLALLSETKEKVATATVTSALREIYSRKREPVIWAPILVGLAGAYFALQKYGYYGAVGVLLVQNTVIVLAIFTMVMILRRQNS